MDNNIWLYIYSYCVHGLISKEIYPKFSVLTMSGFAKVAPI